MPNSTLFAYAFFYVNFIYKILTLTIFSFFFTKLYSVNFNLKLEMKNKNLLPVKFFFLFLWHLSSFIESRGMKERKKYL